ncbi:hypothetical protein MTO96_000469 [Rhipicephalus appendiculatus]
MNPQGFDSVDAEDVRTAFDDVAKYLGVPTLEDDRRRKTPLDAYSAARKIGCTGGHFNLEYRQNRDSTACVYEETYVLHEGVHMCFVLRGEKQHVEVFGCPPLGQQVPARLACRSDIHAGNAPVCRMFYPAPCMFWSLRDAVKTRNENTLCAAVTAFVLLYGMASDVYPPFGCSQL